MNYRKLFAEFLGTFALTFVAIGATAANEMSDGALGLTGIALAIGLTITVMVASTINISGGHINPAVTISLLACGKINFPGAVTYIVSQCLGAILAAFLVKFVFPADILTSIQMGVNSINSAAGVTVSMGLVAEIILTFFLVIVVFLTAVDKGGTKMAPLYIGGVVALDIMAGGPVSSAAMNPARYLGPALLGGGLEQFWIFWVGPITGGLLALVSYKFIFEQKEN